MTNEQFNRYVRYAAMYTCVVSAEQPYVTLVEGDGIRITAPVTDEEFALCIAPEREARELARQLLLAADELERRRFEG